MQGLGIDHEYQAACERNPSAKAFIRANAPTCKVIYKTTVEHIAGVGRNVLDPNVIVDTSRMKSDLLDSGLSGKPFTTCRQKSGITAATGSVEGHEGFSMVFQDFPRMLATNRHRGFIVEEVQRFKRYLHDFLSLCCSHGYSTRCMESEGGIWIDWPRPRYIMFGCGPELGAAKGADAIQHMVEQFTSYRMILPPTPIWSVPWLLYPL